MKSVVLFSGGLDSTYVLQELLKNNAIEKLYVMTVRLMNNDKFLPPNDLSRDLIKGEIEKIFQGRNIKYFENKMEMWVFDAIIDNQTFFWTYNIAHSVCNANVYMGYTIDDLHTKSLTDDTQSIIDIVNRNKTPKSDVKLQFPLLNTRKDEVFKNLMPNLRNLTISCQTPVKLNKFWVSCGNCSSCKLDKKYDIFQPKIFDTENKIIKVLTNDNILNQIKDKTFDIDEVECYVHYIIKAFHSMFDIKSDFIKNNINSEIFNKKQVEVLKFYYEVKK